MPVSVADRLKARGARVHLDDRSETLNYRIREAETLKIPYMAIIGDKEIESNAVSLRGRGRQDLGSLSREELLAKFRSEL